MTFETENSIYHDGEWYDKSRKVLVLPDGTRIENLVSVNEDPIVNSAYGSTGQEFTETDTYFTNPIIDVALVRSFSKHYLISRILKQIDDFAFNGAKIRVKAPEDESAETPEEKIDEVQSKVDVIDSKVVKTVTRMRQATYDSIIYGPAVFERILGDIEGWKAPVVMKRLPAFSFCERPIGRMDIMRYVCGNILYGIVYDKDKDTFEYWQKQNNLSPPVQIPTKNVIYIRDEIAESVDGESFIAKIAPLVRKLEFSDMALMETVHRAGAPLLWISIKEYRDQPVIKGQGIWTPRQAFDEGKKIAINHGKNNAMIAPDSVVPVPLDYHLPIDPIEVVNSIELRILKALIPRDFLEREGNSISSSGQSTLQLIVMIAEGWREKVSLPFIEMWNKILEENGYPGWTIEVQWTDLNPEDKTSKFQRAEIAFKMGSTFTEDELREIAGWNPKSEAARKEEEEAAKKAMEEQQKLRKNVEFGHTFSKKQPQGKPVKTETGEPVKDKQQRPMKNDIEQNSEQEAQRQIHLIMKEKEKLFIEWAKAAGYLSESEPNQNYNHSHDEKGRFASGGGGGGSLGGGKSEGEVDPIERIEFVIRTAKAGTFDKLTTEDKNTIIKLEGLNDKTPGPDNVGGDQPFLSEAQMNVGDGTLKIGNPNHDSTTGRFTFGITSTKSIQELANAAKIALNIKEFSEDEKNVNAQFTLLSDGSPVIEFNSNMFNIDYINSIESANKKWISENSIPYSVANLLSETKLSGYNVYKDYVMTHELGHYKMYQYAKKHEYIEGRTSDSYCQGTKEWKNVAKTCLKSGWKAPSYYAATDYAELYAECHTLHEYGRDDLLHTDIIKFIEVVNEEME